MKYCLLILLFLASIDLAMANSEIDSLESCLKAAKDVEKPVILINLAKAYRSISTEKVIEYADAALNLSIRANNRRQQCKALILLGNAYKRIGKIQSALSYYKKSLDTSKAYGLSDATSSALNNIGNIYKNTGDFDKALDYYLQSLAIDEKIGRKAEIAISYNNIALIYANMNNFDKSEEFCLKALNLGKSINNKTIIALSYTNLATAHLRKKNYDQGEFYYLMAIPLFEEVGDKSSLAINFNNISEVYQKKGDTPKALLYLKKSLAISESLGDQKGIALTRYNLGSLEQKSGKISAALADYDISLAIAVRNKMKDLERELYKSYSEIYESQGKAEKALVYLKKYIEVKDSIFNAEMKDKIAEMQVKFDSQKQMEEIKNLKKDNQIQTLELQKQKDTRQAMIIIFILVLGLLVIAVIIYFVKKKATKLLRLKNAELEEANAKLLQSENNLRELNATKDKFFSIIAHDIRSPLSSCLSLAEVLANNMNLLEEEERSELIGEMSKSAANVNDLLDNLLQWARSQTGTIRFNPDQVDMNEIVSNTIYLLKSNADKKKINLVPDVNDNTLAFADSNMVFTVLRNLVSNAIKFSHANSMITVSATRNNGVVQVEVKDQGIGMKPDEVDKLFRLDVHHSKPGTSNEKGTGLGLILCREFVEKNGGNIRVVSYPGKGSSFIFTLPAQN